MIGYFASRMSHRLAPSATVSAKLSDPDTFTPSGLAVSKVNPTAALRQIPVVTRFYTTATVIPSSRNRMIVGRMSGIGIMSTNPDPPASILRCGPAFSRAVLICTIGKHFRQVLPAKRSRSSLVAPASNALS